jgi:serine/threonine protein kinase
MSSRWGPRAPQEVPEGAAPEPTDVEFITDVEWADPNDRLATGELAPKPKSDHTDPCGCVATEDGMACCVDESCVLYACLEECPANCSAGKACRNRRIGRKEWANVEIVDAGPKGRGLRTCQDIQRGEFIIEYVGRAIRRAYLEKLFSRYKNERMLYIMALDTDVYIDARTKGGKARFINHSCEPNCVVHRWKVNGILRAAIFATKNIEAGEELSFDYKWERKRGRAPTKCHCGTPSCRGTLEMPKSMEEEEEERKLLDHWKKPITKKAGREIVNRSIRIMSEEHHEWFSADVVKYEESNGKHLVMYRANLEETWEDLMKENWMILDEDAEQFVIAKKSALPRSLQPSSSLLDASGFLGAGAGRAQGDVKNYLFVQTPIKDGFLKQGLFDRCQRTVGVVIEYDRLMNVETATEAQTEEEMERTQAFTESKDGFVWKISVSGKGHEAIGHALFILNKNVVFLHNKYDLVLPTSVASSMPKKQMLELSEEVIIPRVIVDHIKRKMPLIRELCRNVSVTFAPSESKSKQFAKLLLEANVEADLYAAKGQLWPQFVAACMEMQAEFNSFGAHKDLGFFGGELTSEQFKLLVGAQRDFTLSQECNEDLRKSPFFNSFQPTQKCTVWVQAEDDIGRIDRHTLSVREAVPNGPRKIYFGCDPKDVPKVWGLVETRAAELARGVRYLHLGVDRMYQQFMIHKGGQFFNYIQRISGASVQIDSMTGDHLRIDGRASGREVIQIGDWDSETTLGESEQAALAEELIKLQIELYRDHCTRHEGWIFGRDWTLPNTAEKPAKSEMQSILSPRVSTPSSRGTGISSNRNQFEVRSVAVACMEIEDINSNMELDGVVAAHAVVILYRFLYVLGENEALGTSSKLRELLLACLFLANKSQKVTKWKRMESLLEAAYKSFYPGTRFDKDNEEVGILENRVIQAETEILDTLDYDVFWRGMDWVLRAAIEGGRLAEPLARNAFETAVSGPVLAAGPEVWLSFGPEYVFSAIAGFLSVDLEPLFSALSLMPYKVGLVAEKILDSINAASISKRASNISIFNAGKESLVTSLDHMKQVCRDVMTSKPARSGKLTHSNLSEVGTRYMLIGQRDSRRLVFRGVSSAVVRNIIVPIIDGVSAESKCKILVGENDQGGSEDILLEGSWRPLAIAEYLLKTACAEKGPFPAPVDTFSTKEDDVYKQQSKRRPGLLSMSAIHTSEGWDGTIQSKLLNDSASLGRKVGGKACVAGKIPEGALRKVGLRWWIPPRYGPSPSASICDMFCTRTTVEGEAKRMEDLNALADLCRALVGEASASTDFPVLSSLSSRGVENGHADRCVAVSMQRWPSEKVANKEHGKSSSKQSQLGYSPSALQEMQLLTQLHSLIPSSQGHPNFILPIAIALPQDLNNTLNETPEANKFGLPQQDIFSLFQTSEQNERRKEKEKKRKEMATGPHLVFHPTPFVLQRVISRSKKNRDEPDLVMSSPLLSSWFHDLLSALVHCHTNHVVLRAFQADQVFLDESGVAKLSGLYRATILPPNERLISIDPLRNARSPKKEKGRDKHDDVFDIGGNPYVAPETLLGCMKHTKETDIWSVGCLMANVILSKPLFVGKERTAMLMAMFKIVGTPGKDNYHDATRFPHYSAPPKKYKRGVEKAFQHMMKEEDYKEHEKAIDLIAAMLHLDPRKRITAVDALKHEYMIQYVEDCATEAFRKFYVTDWMSLKKRLMYSSKHEEDEARQKDQSAKRKAMLLATKSSPAAGDEVDDLYDMDDILGRQAMKKSKLAVGSGSGF